jgi:protein SCO1/2
MEEKTGQVLPPDITLFDETGGIIRLKNLLGKPAILTLIYYSCEHICPQMLEGLSQALPRLAVEPSRDYRVITVSFDASDTPQIARRPKKLPQGYRGRFRTMPGNFSPVRNGAFMI